MKEIIYYILILCFIINSYQVIGINDKINIDPFNQHEIIINSNTNSQNNTVRPIRIGIIGGGIGGSSCAYYLNKIFTSGSGGGIIEGGNQQNQINQNLSSGQSPIEITIFEKDRIGGRTRSYSIENGNVELGASIIHPLNENLNNIVKELGLEKTIGMNEKDEKIHIWNGKEMVFSESSFGFIDKIKLLVNYYWDPIRFKNSRDDIVQKFLSSYQRKEPFHTVEEFFQIHNLTNTTQQTAKEYFLNEIGISENFIQDILSAAIRVNYNQEYDSISAFAAMIALVGSEDGLYAIKGGNYQLPQAMIKDSKSNTIHSTVLKVEKLEASENKEGSGSGIGGEKNPIYKVYSQDPSNTDIINEYEFDFIVLATPIELSGIEFSKNINTDFPKRSFKDVNVYLVAADSLSPNYFNLQTPPIHVLTAYNKSLPFYSVCKNPRGVIEDGRTLYKIFAPAKISDDILDQIFNNYTVYLHHVWKAYPVLTPTTKFPPIQIDTGLYYINSFEHSVSTMETETISSKNIAKLIATSIKRPFKLI